MTESFGRKEAFEGHLVQILCTGWLLKAWSSLALNVSRNRACSLSNLFQCLTTLIFAYISSLNLKPFSLGLSHNLNIDLIRSTGELLVSVGIYLTIQSPSTKSRHFYMFPVSQPVYLFSVKKFKLNSI